jgi:hypothetical protein
MISTVEKASLYRLMMLGFNTKPEHSGVLKERLAKSVCRSDVENSHVRS